MLLHPQTRPDPRRFWSDSVFGRYGQPVKFDVDDSGQVVSSAGEWVFTDAEAQGGVEAVRHLSRQAVLAPLYRGRRPDAWKENIGGIIFVGIDNSTYQVSPSQHQVLREALASVRADASPTTVGVVLMCHIPLFDCLASGPRL